MKIFITGGAGFVGTHLTSHLATKGHELLVYDNLSAGNPAPFLVLGDLLEVRALNAAVSSFQPDAIIHLAALHFIPDCERDPSRTLRVNVEGTQNVLAAAAFAKRSQTSSSPPPPPSTNPPAATTTKTTTPPPAKYTA
jgi:nucleoside-diphosphate-sugar epimerase